MSYKKALTLGNLPVDPGEFEKLLQNAISVNEEADVELGHNVHVDGKLLTEGGIASNGTTDLGDLEGVSLIPVGNITGNDATLYLFGSSAGFVSIYDTPSGSISAGEAIYKAPEELKKIWQRQNFNILCKEKGGSIFWLEGALNGNDLYFQTNMNLTGNDFYGFALVYLK